MNMATPDSLNVVALISGGKDSFYSILHCLKNGHNIIALANLYPSPALSHPSSEISSNDEEIDSHMYQTVGASVIPLYAEALGLPLYRHAISGSAVNKNRSYSSKAAEADETESLVPLLAKVKAAHPEVNAISTGAILSDYQRTRIESVALRLGLTPLAFLWQYPYLPPYTQGSLLADMSAVGQDSRIIKVASGGLDERHLWLNVADAAGVTARKLAKEMGRFGGLVGGAVLGEGGEYETLAIDGPSPVWKKRILIEGGGREVITEGGVSSLKMRGARTMEKEKNDNEQACSDRLRVPELWDDEFAGLAESLASQDHAKTENANLSRDYIPHSRLAPKTTFLGATLYISNLQHEMSGRPLAEQMEHIINRLSTSLVDNNLAPSDIAFTTILLRNMSDFAAVNASYSILFDTPNPPARVTIACSDTLPPGIDVVLSAIAHGPSPQHARQGLHVQSRSYWAPANIGPYSQAISIAFKVHTKPGGKAPEVITPPRMVYVAGQIPLAPASMTIVSPDFATQAALSLQHLWRIGRVMQVDWWVSCVAFINASDENEARERAKMAVRAWESVHIVTPEVEDDESEDMDIAERDLRRPWATQEDTGAAGQTLKTVRRPLPRWEVLDRRQSKIEPVPQMFVAEVAELPRSASIEWASFGVAEVGEQKVRIDREGHGGVCSIQGALTMICDTAEDDEHVAHLLGEMALRYEAAEGLVEVYASGPISAGGIGGLHVQVFPCRSVWDKKGRRVFAVLRCRTFSAII